MWVFHKSKLASNLLEERDLTIASLHDDAFNRSAISILVPSLEASNGVGEQCAVWFVRQHPDKSGWDVWVAFLLLLALLLLLLLLPPVPPRNGWSGQRELKLLPPLQLSAANWAVASYLTTHLSCSPLVNSCSNARIQPMQSKPIRYQQTL